MDQVRRVKLNKRITIQKIKDAGPLKNKEYEDYFLFDVMHVGVKGWMEVEKELYKFANQDN